MCSNPPFSCNLTKTSIATQMCTPPGQPAQICIGLSGPFPPAPTESILSTKVSAQVGGGAELFVGMDNRGVVSAGVSIPLGKVKK
ncbi:hypothetical protein L211DRAFT_833034 [Terfezia boudieri ATCC MYA-4762]|uniref:Uncharacterized protein n=1 Tax=Terfezia boudieri ATCC MYA-4762 TaxID=1051890 RepID=A0A3N4M1X5_9PEZI|nr:hypothetical protein L211DRAFT_833034 [Terfezia boudieri ATCC MYA-4762]